MFVIKRNLNITTVIGVLSACFVDFGYLIPIFGLLTATRTKFPLRVLCFVAIISVYFLTRLFFNISNFYFIIYFFLPIFYSLFLFQISGELDNDKIVSFLFIIVVLDFLLFDAPELNDGRHTAFSHSSSIASVLVACVFFGLRDAVRLSGHIQNFLAQIILGSGSGIIASMIFYWKKTSANFFLFSLGVLFLLFIDFDRLSLGYVIQVFEHKFDYAELAFSQTTSMDFIWGVNGGDVKGGDSAFTQFVVANGIIGLFFFVWFFFIIISKKTLVVLAILFFSSFHYGVAFSPFGAFLIGYIGSRNWLSANDY